MDQQRRREIERLYHLARAMQDQAAAGLTHSPTITEAMTRPGVVLGTAAYMSPEQARGRTADKRADIWAFGCILFECLTGRRAFQGETITEMLAAILKNEPEWTLLPAETHPFVRAVLRQCLQKDPSLRLHDIADARLEIQEALFEPTRPAHVSPRFARGLFLSVAAATLVIGILIGWAVAHYSSPATSAIAQPVVRSPIRLEPGLWLDGGRWLPPYGFNQPTRTAMAISSDGRLWKVSVSGGVPVNLCEAGNYYAASWGYGDSIVYAVEHSTDLLRVSANGGKPETLTTPDKTNDEAGHRLPHWLPDGRGILFTITREMHDSHPRVALLDLKSRKWAVLLEDAADARYVSTGHLVFVRQGTLMAVPFDLRKLQLAGQPVPTISNVMQASNIAWGG